MLFLVRYPVRPRIAHVSRLLKRSYSALAYMRYIGRPRGYLYIDSSQPARPEAIQPDVCRASWGWLLGLAALLCVMLINPDDVRMDRKSETMLDTKGVDHKCNDWDHLMKSIEQGVVDDNEMSRLVNPTMG